ELEKYKIMNKDRLDLLTEIEEKNNVIFDSKNKVKTVEAEFGNLQKNYTLLEIKYNEHVKTLSNNENKISELKNKLNDIIKEKEDISLNYQKKLEILQNKLLDDAENLEENSNEKNTENNLIKVIEMLNDSINDMKVLFKSKFGNLMDLVKDFKEE